MKILRNENDYQGAKFPDGKKGFFHHLRIFNDSFAESANNCSVFLSRINDTPMPLVELKWKGLTQVKASIPERNYRLVDAFHIIKHDPFLNFGINKFNVDWEGYTSMFRVPIPITLTLGFTVVSDNFPTVHQSFRLEVETVNNIVFEETKTNLVEA